MYRWYFYESNPCDCSQEGASFTLVRSMSPELLFWYGLALKKAMTAAIVVIVLVAVERSGPFLGALIASLPTATGAAYIILAIQFEERDLVAEHGDSYRRYRRSVPMLLPTLSRKRRLETVGKNPTPKHVRQPFL